MLLDKTTVGYYVMLEAAMSIIPEAGQDRDPTESPGDCYRAHQILSQDWALNLRARNACENI